MKSYSDDLNKLSRSELWVFKMYQVPRLNDKLAIFFIKLSSNSHTESTMNVLYYFVIEIFSFRILKLSMKF